jgi:hypothetical protein
VNAQRSAVRSIAWLDAFVISIDFMWTENHPAGDKKEEKSDPNQRDPHALRLISNVDSAPRAKKRYAEKAGEKRDDLEPIRSHIPNDKHDQNRGTEDSEE